MNTHIKSLYKISRKKSRNIIGLMSGTSLDGLDIALCRISGSGGDTKVRVRKFTTVVYDEALKAEIREIFAKENIDFQHLVLLNEKIGQLHGTMINDALKAWRIDPLSIDLIASHGQTVFHAPRFQHQKAEYGNATLQIGDGDHLAHTTGIITLADFRQRHIAAGGEGAPLAVYGDYFVFSDPTENRIMLNMGGIANFTYLPASLDASAVFVTDTGTGNTLIDAFTRHFYPEKSYDEDAKIALSGTPNTRLLAALKNHPFFVQKFPKTTGPEVFNKIYVENALQAAQIEMPKTPADIADLLATLTLFSAETIGDALQQVFDSKGFSAADIATFKIYMSGGGAHNPLLVKHLYDRFPQITFKNTSVLGINGDAKEAVLFAILANECVAGGNTNFGNREGIPSVSMGKICFPR